MGILRQNLSSKFEGRVRKGQKQLPYAPRAEVLKHFYGSPISVRPGLEFPPGPGPDRD